MKAKNIFFVFVLTGLIFISGCDKTDEITNPGIDLVVNIPNVSNSSKSFAFALKASSYNAALEYAVSYTSLELNLSLSITGSSSGDASIQLWNENKQMISKLDYNQNVNLTQTITLDLIPSKIKLIFSNFTGTFNLAITSK